VRPVLVVVLPVDAQDVLEVAARRVRKLERADLQGNSSGPRGAARLELDALVRRGITKE
jgi:hypothetical protein